MTQNADGTAHLAYFDRDTQLSFVWDCFSPFVEVCHGGYAEPVSDLAPVVSGSIPLHGADQKIEVLTDFHVAIQTYLANYKGQRLSAR
jgi:hypothetical protein